jgi:hypothetical protein
LAGLSDQKWSAQRSGQSSPASAADQLVSKRLWKPDVSLLVTCPPPTQPPRLKPSSLVPRALAHKTRLFPTFLSRISPSLATKSQRSRQLILTLLQPLSKSKTSTSALRPTPRLSEARTAGRIESQRITFRKPIRSMSVSHLQSPDPLMSEYVDYN